MKNLLLACLTDIASAKFKTSPKLILLFAFLSLVCLTAQAQDKKALDSLMRVYNTAQHDTTKIMALTSIAHEYRNIKPDTCISIAEKALQISEKIEFERGKGWAKNRIARGKLTKQDFANAMDLLTQAQAHFEKANDLKGLAWNYNILAYAYQQQNKTALVIEIYEKSIIIGEKIKDKQGIAAILSNIGVIYDIQGNFPLALAYYQKSLKIQEEIADKQGIAASLSNIGVIYLTQGNYPLALEYFQKSLKINEAIGNKQGIAANLTNIGIIHDRQGNLTLALEYHQKSLKIREEIGDKQGIAANLSNIGVIYDMQGNKPLALEYYQKSLKIREEIGDKQGIAISLITIGSTYQTQGNYPLALAYLQKSLKINEEISDKQGQTYSLTGLADVAQKQKDYDKSIEYAQKSLQIAQEIEAPAEIKSASQTLYNSYKLKGDYVKALEYHELYKTTNDSLFNVDKAKKIANLEATVEIEKKAKEIEILNKNKELSQKEKEVLEKDLKLQSIEAERQKNAKLALEKEAEVKALFYQATQEKDKRKADSLRSLAQTKQLEVEKYLAQEQKLKAESQARKAELQASITQLQKGKEVKEFQRYIIYLIGALLVSALIFSYFIYRSRQKEIEAKQEVTQKNEEITQQNEEILLQSEMLEKANQTKDKLFAILGHDLRGPIGSLENVLNLMNMGVISYEEFQEFMPQFHKNVKNMQSTLENLLQWSISQMRGIHANPTVVGLCDVVKEKMQLFGEIAKAKNITLLMEVSEEIAVWADENHVRLLLRNLINNALKFTPEAGKITVITQAVESKIIINIVDTGVGMTPAQVGKLFKKNQNFTTYGTGGEKGTGLGLQLCQEIVAKNDGEIWVTSEVGKGSKFSFSLPATSK